ncbi:hypothetical protein CBL_20385 [Carabus blaptoides fortunei]
MTATKFKKHLIDLVIKNGVALTLFYSLAFIGLNGEMATKPQGKNPSDDFYSVAKGTSTSLSTLTINPMGASIRLGILGCRKWWRIEKIKAKREGISDNVLVLSDGGESPWNCMNSHLDDYTLKERQATTKEEKEYLLRIMNPENPFVEGEEGMVCSKEHGTIMLDKIETPRNVFNLVK